MKSRLAITISVNSIVFIGQIVLLVLLNHFQIVNQPFNSVISIISILLIFLIVLVELISLKFDKTASINTLISAIFIFGMVLLDGDTLSFYSYYNLVVEPRFYSFLASSQYVCFIGAIVFLIRFFVRDFHIKTYKVEMYVTLILMILSITSYIVSLFYGTVLYTAAITVLVMFYWLVKILYSTYIKKNITVIFMISTFIYVLLCGAQLTNAIIISVPSFASVGITSSAFLFVGLSFLSIYLTFAILTTKKAYQKEELEKKANKLQANVLLKQMNSHFLFNSLNKVKTQYAIDNEQGNHTIDLLAKQLRALTDSGKENVISLREELDLVLNYVELMNVDLDKPFRLIFNIENDDFYVPYFSIQTIVENAIKYSGVNVENGYIEIKAYSDKDNNYVIIRDTGKGFDIHDINLEKGYGLNNVKERLQILFNGTLKVESSLNNGTVVTMIIPRGEKQA